MTRRPSVVLVGTNDSKAALPRCSQKGRDSLSMMGQDAIFTHLLGSPVSKSNACRGSLTQVTIIALSIIRLPCSVAASAFPALTFHYAAFRCPSCTTVFQVCIVLLFIILKATLYQVATLCQCSFSSWCFTKNSTHDVNGRALLLLLAYVVVDQLQIS